MTTQPIFFQRGAGLALADIAALAGAEIDTSAPAHRRIADIAPLDRAGPHQLSYCESRKYVRALAATRAGACLVTPELEDFVPAGAARLRTAEPYRAFVKAACALFPAALRPSTLFEASGLSLAATVHPTARLEPDVTVDPGVVIGPRAEIGAGTAIAANAVIGAGVRIGRNCSIGAGATIAHALIGDRVIVHPGVRIGQDGFGFVPGAQHRKVPQIGRVIVQDDVEIGANTTVDRGGLNDTTIGEGTKIDNLVQIAHNVTIGRHCILAGQVGVSGSSRIDDYAVLGGQVGLVDHIHIGEGAMIAAKSGVMADVPPGARMAGAPAEPIKDFMRSVATVRRLTRREPSKAGSAPGERDGGDRS